MRIVRRKYDYAEKKKSTQYRRWNEIIGAIMEVFLIREKDDFQHEILTTERYLELESDLLDVRYIPQDVWSDYCFKYPWNFYFNSRKKIEKSLKTREQKLRNENNRNNFWNFCRYFL